MTFDEAMKKYNGVWDQGAARITESGYIWIIAKGTPDKYELTSDGKRYVTDLSYPEEKPKRGRKPAVVLQSVDE